jgi:DNA-binding IclR family transcriptional regulator
MPQMSIQSIERAFSILKIVGDHPEGIRIGVTAEIANLHVSTVSRIVATLEDLEVVRRLSPAGKVAIGPGLIELVARAPWTERLAAIARPHLQRLADETGESVGLTRIEGVVCHVFYQIRSSRFNVQVRDWTGGTFPLHVTSTGKLYLAHIDKGELDAILKSPLPKAASRTITSTRQLRREIKEVRQQGFAWTIDELEDGLTSIAVPIHGRGGEFLAGVYVSAPSYRFVDEGERDRLRNLTQRTGRDVCRQLEQLHFVV